MPRQPQFPRPAITLRYPAPHCTLNVPALKALFANEQAFVAIYAKAGILELQPFGGPKEYVAEICSDGFIGVAAGGHRHLSLTTALKKIGFQDRLKTVELKRNGDVWRADVFGPAASDEAEIAGPAGVVAA